MDLSQFKLDDAQEIVIDNPVTGEPTDIVIKAYGQMSKTARNYIIDLARKTKGEEEFSMPTDEDYYAEMIVGWENVEVKGKKVKFSKEAAKEILAEHSFLVVQLNVKLKKAGYSPKQ